KRVTQVPCPILCAGFPFSFFEGFKVVEVNGAGAEAVHIWDPDYPILAGYRTLFRQQSLMFAIGAANRARGIKPMTLRELVACQRRQNRLLSRYPTSG
ncbi:MAG TPA: hypothetical protein VK196_22765, partial [Magnetospirillum sp.]|nr:hypothetical protein [Magnetospirillum sp.]